MLLSKRTCINDVHNRVDLANRDGTNDINGVTLDESINALNMLTIAYGARIKKKLKYPYKSRK